MSPNQFSVSSKTRYPSTPALAHSLQKHFSQIDTSIPAIFDDDETDSILSTSSFRSCNNSLSELSVDTHTPHSTSSSSSSLSESSFPNFSTTSDLPHGNLPGTLKSTRASFRHFCILQ
ncbi:hypothetical protein I4U23_006620 [Adineta vaga]|nr:hypothetical protein I4U23_006620 [Adineta vaga]